MTRQLIGFLVIVVIVLTALALFSRDKVVVPPQVANQKPQITSVTPTPNAAPDISDQALDNELTALDRDLLKIQQTETELDKELQNI